MPATEAPQSVGTRDPEVSRSQLLARFASAVFAGLIAPEVVQKLAGAAPATPAGTLAPLPDVPASINGEDPIVRMAEDVRRALQKPVDQRRWGMLIDLRKCTGCQGCTIACVQENKLPPGIVYRPVIEETQGTYPNVSRRFVPRPCMQCDSPPCVPVCPVQATYKRPDGIVAIDYNVCIGCRYCITACPYNARTFDFGEFYGDATTGQPEAYELLPSLEYGKVWRRGREGSPVGNARKCHFCIHRIEQGLLPACVLSCMGRATYFGDLNDPTSLISELVAKPNVMRLKEDLGTQPKVYYLV